MKKKIACCCDVCGKPGTCTKRQEGPPGWFYFKVIDGEWITTVLACSDACKPLLPWKKCRR